MPYKLSTLLLVAPVVCSCSAEMENARAAAPTSSGPGLVNPRAIDEMADGMLVVIDNGLEAVVQVDPSTGNRSSLYGADHGGRAFE